MIPKVIHYCWLSNDPIPQDLQTYMQTWKEKLSDYEFVLWNFDRFDINSSLWVKQAFENKKYAFAADYIRLYAVYNYGGIYMDMDIEVLKSFDDLLDAPLMLAYENEERSGIEAGCFGAEKGNPLIGECLSYYVNRPFIKADGSFDTLPLPQIMIKYVQRYPEIKPFSKDYFTCKSTSDGKITVTENSYSIHNFAGSWLTDDSRESLALHQKVFSKIKNHLLANVIFYSLRFFQRVKKHGLIGGLSYFCKRYVLHKQIFGAQ